MKFFKMWGNFLMMGAQDPCTLGAECIEHHPEGQKAIDHSGAVDRTGNFGRYRICRPDRRCAAGAAGRKRGLQPGLLQYRHFYRVHSHRPGCRSDYRVHRRRRRVYHCTGLDECRCQRDSGGRDRPVSYLCQGDYGQCHAPKTRERFRPAGRGFFDRLPSSAQPSVG